MVWPTELSVTDDGVIVIRVGTGVGGGGTGVAGGGGSGAVGFVGLSLPQVVRNTQVAISKTAAKHEELFLDSRFKERVFIRRDPQRVKGGTQSLTTAVSSISKRPRK